MSFATIAPSPKTSTPPASMTATEEPVKASAKAAKKSRKSTTAKTSSKPTQGDTSVKKSSSKPTTSSSGLHRRSRSGCYTCRLRRKKCDEGHPSCRACKNLKLRCEYERPIWWSNTAHRDNQKDCIKELIRSTKATEKAATCPRQICCTYSPPSLTHSASTPETHPDVLAQPRDISAEPPYSVDQDFTQTDVYDYVDPYGSQFQTPGCDSTPFWQAPTPYEVDVKTESEVYVNDIPTRRDSSTSTFSTFQPPMAHAMLPSFVGDDWMQQDMIFGPRDEEASKEFPEQHNSELSHVPAITTSIKIEDNDRHLLDHFFEQVADQTFPILEARRRGGVLSDVILPAIESNKCYLHCCLSIAAVHIKTTQHIYSDRIDNDILKHRYEAVSELCTSLNEDTDHLQILEGTLGMTFFQRTVGRADDSLPDVPWHQHFQAATSLIHKLELPNHLLETDNGSVNPPFNMSLAAWIDILGSTLLGQMPQFAHTYRTKLFGGSSSGLCDLMGCEDRVMYLIAEVSCLDALCAEGRIDHVGLCGHITNLAQQFDHTEPPQGSLVKAISDEGVLNTHQLSKNMTALYRVAARVYLCSLVPGFQCDQQGTVNLVSYAAELLELIPSGPSGFDTSLVWPLLICGSYSTPDSSFRKILNDRIEELGGQGELGSFGRMVCVLREVWRLSELASSSDIPITSTEAFTVVKVEAETPRLLTPPLDGQQQPQELPLATTGQVVHWREVMRQNEWDFLLI